MCRCSTLVKRAQRGRKGQIAQDQAVAEIGGDFARLRAGGSNKNFRRPLRRHAQECLGGRIEAKEVGQMGKLFPFDALPGEHFSKKQNHLAQHVDPMLLPNHVGRRGARADSYGDILIAGQVGQGAETGGEVYRRPADRVGYRRADMGARFCEDRRQGHERILMGQMIRNPEPSERILGHRPLRVRRRVRSRGQRIELHAKTHFLDWFGT
jgi:hypothetical protein